MNKIINSVLLAAAAIFMVSCSDDDMPEIPQITDITFVAQKPSFDTDVIKSVWREREGMRFFSDNASQAQSYYLLRNEEPAAVGNFRYDRGGDITLWNDFAAFHGYGFGALDNFEAKVYQTQKFIPNAIDAEEDMLISQVYKVSDIDFAQPVTIQLKRINAILDVNIVDETSDKILIGDSITSVSLTTNNPKNNFAGSIYIDFYTGKTKIADNCSSKEAISDGNNSIRIGEGKDKLLMSVLPISLVEGQQIEVQLKTKCGRYAKNNITLLQDLILKEGSYTPIDVHFEDKDIIH